MNEDFSKNAWIEYRQGERPEILIGFGIGFLVFGFIGAIIATVLLFSFLSSRRKKQAVLKQPAQKTLSSSVPSPSPLYGTPAAKVQTPTEFCPICGFVLPGQTKDSIFCPKCGSKMLD